MKKQDEEEKEVEVTKVEGKNNKLIIVRIILGIIVIGAIVTTIIIAKQTEVTLIPFIIITSFLILVFIISFIFRAIGNFFKNKFKSDEEKIPEPINEEKRLKLIEEKVRELMNHILKDSKIEFVKSDNINDNLIYAYKLNLLYKESFGECGIFILNANYPDDGITIIKGDSTKKDIYNEMNSKSRNPKDKPDIEEEETENETLGTKTHRKRTIHKKKDKKKEEKRENIA